MRGGLHRLPFISVEDLCVFKITFDRPKDWADLQAIADASTLVDVSYVSQWILYLSGESIRPRLRRFLSIWEERENRAGQTSFSDRMISNSDLGWDAPR